jgi:hypothetical protein
MAYPESYTGGSGEPLRPRSPRPCVGGEQILQPDSPSPHFSEADGERERTLGLVSLVSASIGFSIARWLYPDSRTAGRAGRGHCVPVIRLSFFMCPNVTGQAWVCPSHAPVGSTFDAFKVSGVRTPSQPANDHRPKPTRPRPSAEGLRAARRQVCWDRATCIHRASVRHFPLKHGHPARIRGKGAELDVTCPGSLLHEKPAIRGPCVATHAKDPEGLEL